MQALYMEKHRTGIYDIFSGNELAVRARGMFYAHLCRIERSKGTKELVAELKRRSHALLQPSESKYHVRKDGTWRGPWRPLSRLARRGRDGLCCALRILKLYGLFVAREPTLRDYLDTAIAISEQPEKTDIYYYTGLKQEIRQCKTYRSVGFSRYYPLSTTKVPIDRDFASSEIFVTPEKHIRALDNCPEVVLNHYEFYRELVGPSLPPLEFYLDLSTKCTIQAAGQIRLLTKDRGLKMRAVVNPFRLHQLATSRLANTLFSYLKDLDECHVFDQDIGACWVRGRLQSGAKLSSIDLKAASDNIPMLPQIQLVRQLFPWLSGDLDLFGELSRCTWWGPFGVDSDCKYTRGHGMGLNGSFPMFTLWLLYLCYKAGARSAFAIVGDDLVIESKYEEKVVGFLSHYGVPINHAKSIFNHDIAEFVGRVIDRWGSLNVYKASPLDLKRDPLGFIRQYGVKSFNRTSMKFKVGKSFRKRLQLFRDASNSLHDQFLLAHFVDTKDVPLVTGCKPPRYNVGGIPGHLAREIIKTVVDPADRDRTGKFLSDILEMDDSTQQAALMPYLVLEFSRPGFTRYHVKSWEFQGNPAYLVRFHQQRVDEALKRNPLFFVEGGELQITFNKLNEDVPDLDRVIEDAKDKRLLSQAKRQLKNEELGRYPASHINRFARAWIKGLCRLKSLLDSL